MDTQQGYEYLFAKAVAVLMCHGFSGVACVCVNRNTNTGKKSMLLSTNVGFWFSYLQPDFAMIVQMKLFLLNVDWEEESYLQEN